MPYLCDLANYSLFMSYMNETVTKSPTRRLLWTLANHAVDITPWGSYSGLASLARADLVQQPLITLREAAALSGLSPSQLRTLARLGRIEAVKMGRDWFTTQQAVAKYMTDWELRKHDPMKKRRGD